MRSDLGRSKVSHSEWRQTHHADRTYMGSFIGKREREKGRERGERKQGGERGREKRKRKKKEVGCILPFKGTGYSLPCMVPKWVGPGVPGC